MPRAHVRRVAGFRRGGLSRRRQALRACSTWPAPSPRPRGLRRASAPWWQDRGAETTAASTRSRRIAGVSATGRGLPARSRAQLAALDARALTSGSRWSRWTRSVPPWRSAGAGSVPWPWSSAKVQRHGTRRRRRRRRRNRCSGFPRRGRRRGPPRRRTVAPCGAREHGSPGRSASRVNGGTSTAPATRRTAWPCASALVRPAYTTPETRSTTSGSRRGWRFVLLPPTSRATAPTSTSSTGRSGAPRAGVRCGAQLPRAGSVEGGPEHLEDGGLRHAARAHEVGDRLTPDHVARRRVLHYDRGRDRLRFRIRFGGAELGGAANQGRERRGGRGRRWEDASAPARVVGLPDGPQHAGGRARRVSARAREGWEGPSRRTSVGVGMVQAALGAARAAQALSSAGAPGRSVRGPRGDLRGVPVLRARRRRRRGGDGPRPRRRASLEGRAALRRADARAPRGVEGALGAGSPRRSWRRRSASRPTTRCRPARAPHRRGCGAPRGLRRGAALAAAAVPLAVVLGVANAVGAEGREEWQRNHRAAASPP